MLGDLGSVTLGGWEVFTGLRGLLWVMAVWALIGVRTTSTALEIALLFSVIGIPMRAGLVPYTEEPLTLGWAVLLLVQYGLVLHVVLRPNQADVIHALKTALAERDEELARYKEK